MHALATRVGPARPGTDLSRCAAHLRSLCEREGLLPRDLRQVLGELTPDQQRAMSFLTGDAPLPRRREVREVLERLEDHLGVDLGARELTGRPAQIGRRVADAIGLVLAIVCGYIVVGGLLGGHSLLLGDRFGAVGLVLFLIVLAVLALFEALHTSATMLKIADLGALAREYPRAAALHRQFHTDRGLARFLAGRQMVVVLTVFICSPLSSFPELRHWPLLDAPLPGLLRPFVVVGMPGALFVLWVGQLLPQFLATRHAVRLTNARVVTLAFRLAYALDGVGFARPGFWLAAWDRTSERIPSSPAMRWRQAAEELDGYGSVGVVREWSLAREICNLRAASTTRLYRDGMSSLIDGTLLVPGTPVRLTLDAGAAHADGAPVRLAASEHREEILPTGDRRFHKPVISAVGSLRTHDTLQVTLDAAYRRDPARDLVHVDRPLRFIVFRVAPEWSPRIMAPARLSRYAIGDGLGDLTEDGPPIAVEPRWNDDGVPVLEHVVHWPMPNTLYVLEWEVDFDG